VADLARLRRAVSVPIAADESIRRAADPLAVKRAEAADVVVIKVQPLGGVRACLALAEELGLPMVVSSALESSVGIAAGVALAAALPGIEFASGLATVSMLRRRRLRHPAGAAWRARCPCGRGRTPDALTPAPDAVVARWLERLHRVADLGGIDLEEVLA
jgi:O-succinylbenzoate synthase